MLLDGTDGKIKGSYYAVDGTTVIDSSRNLTNIGNVTASGKIIAEDNVSLGGDGSYGGYGTLAFSGFTNGHNRIFGGNDTTRGLYLCSANTQSIYFRANGSTANHLLVDGNGSATASGLIPRPYILR